ncbi:origin recognition complex subunit 4 [Dispira simplex]|nr:origin recognition complex subunit 4 [Dispira simplex]
MLMEIDVPVLERNPGRGEGIDEAQWSFPRGKGANWVREVRREIVNVLSERTPPRELLGLDEPYNKLYNVVEKSIVEGESNSVLVVGQRGTGKSTIVSRALDSLRLQQPHFHVIQLNGVIHTDDRAALREIAQQLDRNVISDQQLKALDLDHQVSDEDHSDPEPESESENKEEDNPPATNTKRPIRRTRSIRQKKPIPTVPKSTPPPKRTFSETLFYLLSFLKKGGRKENPIVFILDEFDLFSQHPKQTLLYTLFDVVQSHQLPVLVIGITARLDAVELLEKRVKSRFSHRQISVYPPSDFKTFTSIAQNALVVQLENSPAFSNACLEYRRVFNEHVQQLLRRHYDILRDVRSLYRLLLSFAFSLSTNRPFFTFTKAHASIQKQLLDSKVELIKDQDMTKFNFEIVYNEYKAFMTCSRDVIRSGMKHYKKGVALKAFEHLLTLELIRPAESASGSFNEANLGATTTAVTHAASARLASVHCPKEYTMVQLVLDAVQVEDAVRAYQDCPQAIRHWGLTN